MADVSPPKTFSATQSKNKRSRKSKTRKNEREIVCAGSGFKKERSGGLDSIRVEHHS